MSETPDPVARHGAGPLLSAAVRACGEEFTRLAGCYDAAANTAYRELHEPAAGTGSTAA